MTDWQYRIFILAELDRLTAANNSAQAYDPDVGGDETFGAVRLSVNGQEPATHTGCNTAATEDMRTAVLQAFSNVPFYKVYFERDGWTWETALADAGLKLIQNEVL